LDRVETRAIIESNKESYKIK